MTITNDEWVDLFKEQHWHQKWVYEFLKREGPMLEREWFGIEDWLQSQYHTDFVSGSFFYHNEKEWEDIEEEWIKTCKEYEFGPDYECEC